MTSKNHLSLLTRYKKIALELCHLSHELSSQYPKKFLYRQIKILCLEAQNRVQGQDTDDIKLQKLRKYYFDDLGFHGKDSYEKPLDDLLLPNFLKKSKGPFELLTLTFLTLCESIGLKARSHRCKNGHLVKIFLGGHPFILDMARNGQFLSHGEIVEKVNNGADFNQVPPHNHLMIQYLKKLKYRGHKENNPAWLINTQNYLIKNQPFNLNHLSERALLAYENGDLIRTVQDITDYFLYIPSDTSNFRLKTIYNLAQRKIKRLT